MGDGAIKLPVGESSAESLEFELEGMGRCSVGLFTDFLYGLVKRRWTGGITIESADSIKKNLFLRQGELVFATSNLIDDRLGEVAYRRGLISLDQLFSTSVKVEANMKFGQLLMENNIFTKLDLWEALKVQLLEIIKSIMLEENIFFEVDTDRVPASVIVFDENTEKLLDRAYSFGCMYRDFAAGLKPETVIAESDSASSSLQEGNFMHDIFKIMIESGTVESFIEASRLSKPYSLLALMDNVHYGYCTLSPEVKLSFEATPHSDAVLKKINSYAQVLELISKLLKDANQAFPIQDISLFAHNLNSPTFLSIFVDDKGRLSPNSINCMLSQSRSSFKQSEYYSRCIESLIHFLVQAASDVLPREGVDRMRAEVAKFTR